MKLRQRVTTAAAALMLTAGLGLAAPAAASAADPQLHVSNGHPSQAVCELSRSMFLGVLYGRGGTVHGGQDCVRYANGTWGYTVLYKG